MSTAEHMHQTTLMQCNDSPFATAPDPPPSAMASGYRCIDIDGQKYLLNETSNHLLVVPPAAKKNVMIEKARSMSPVNLAKASFEVLTPHVTRAPSKRTATAQALADFVLLSENLSTSGSEDEIVYVQQLCKKKRKPVPSPESSPEVQVEVQVIVQVKVESHGLPMPCNFAGNSRVSVHQLDSGSETNVNGNSNDKSSDQSVNLLEDD
jgi:hypothetical protein